MSKSDKDSLCDDVAVNMLKIGASATTSDLTDSQPAVSTFSILLEYKKAFYNRLCTHGTGMPVGAMLIDATGESNQAQGYLMHLSSNSNLQ